MANTNCRHTGIITLFSRSLGRRGRAASRRNCPQPICSARLAYAHPFDDSTPTSSSRTCGNPPLGHPTGRSILQDNNRPRGSSDESDAVYGSEQRPPRPRGLPQSQKDPASERDSDRPVDQRKNDGVDHASLHCFLRTRKSHCLSKLSGFTAADLIDDTLNPVGRLEDGADLAAVVEKAEDSNAVSILARNALSPGGSSWSPGESPSRTRARTETARV